MFGTRLHGFPREDEPRAGDRACTGEPTWCQHGHGAGGEESKHSRLRKSLTGTRVSPSSFPPSSQSGRASWSSFPWIATGDAEDSGSQTQP